MSNKEDKMNFLDDENGLDIGNMNGDIFDPFKDDDFEQEVEQEKESKAKKEAEQQTRPKENEKSEKKIELEENAENSPNPIQMELERAESKDIETAKNSLSEKPPIFLYAGASEEISDTSITFDALRIDKSNDFPELEDGKRVSWTVEYGKIKKNVSTPQKTTIASIKKDIEDSKEFADFLKKSKIQKIECKIIPKITAQSKGKVSYKGVFTTFEEAESSGKIISVFPANDGRVYEMRKTEMGKFITPLSKSNTLNKVEAGFIPALPPVPKEVLLMILDFFKEMAVKGNFEALVNVYWDKEEKSFIADVPNQKVTEYSVSSEISSSYDDERYIHYMDIHSHNSMRAVFSKIDDADEKAARIYVVIGKVLDFFPEIKVRISSSGNFVEIPPQLVFCDVISQECYPQDWKDKVQIASKEIDTAVFEDKAEQGCGEI